MMLLIGSAIVELAIPDYEQPAIPRSLVSVLLAGPIEETIFFGIPFYVFGNGYSLLVTGGVWAGLHLLNTTSLQLNSLAFGSLLFVLPSLFFSLRTWVSGRGWFSILAHSAWNGIFFAAGCSAGDFDCSVLDPQVENTISSILLSAGLVGATYALYRFRQYRERRRLAA